MKKHQCRCVDELRGCALENLKSFDEMRYEPFVSTVTGVPCQENCARCVDTCMYGAIAKAGQTVHVDRAQCVGCGLCTFVCPQEKLSLGLE